MCLESQEFFKKGSGYVIFVAKEGQTFSKEGYYAYRSIALFNRGQQIGFYNGCQPKAASDAGSTKYFA